MRYALILAAISTAVIAAPLDVTLLGKTEAEIIGSLGPVGDLVNDVAESDLVTTVEGAVPVTGTVNVLPTKQKRAPVDVSVLGVPEADIIGALGPVGDLVNEVAESELVTTVEDAVPVTGDVNVLPTRRAKRTPVDVTVLGKTEPEIIGSLGEVGDAVNGLLDSELVTTVEDAVPVTGTINVLPTRKTKRTPVDVTVLGKTEPEIIGSLGEVGDAVNELLDSDLVTTVEDAVPVTGTVNVLPTKQ